jgi:hypothetical protein
MLQRILNFVIDQAIIAGRITDSEEKDLSFKVIPSPIVSRDNKGIAEAVNGLVDGLIKAVDKKWLDNKKAKTVLNAVMTQLGVDMESDPDEELDNENDSSISSESSSSSNSSNSTEV